MIRGLNSSGFLMVVEDIMGNGRDDGGFIMKFN